MSYSWKIPYILKGMLTWIPVLNYWRLRRASTGGSSSPRYCYSVWLRHLVMLDLYGFRVTGSQVGELGPGDSIGVGLAALISGAARYVGLDSLPFSAKANLERTFDELAQMYSRQESIPDHTEFPAVRPTLKSYEFPDHVVERTNLAARVDEIRHELRDGVIDGPRVNYLAPWTSKNEIAADSLDLIFSQAVMEHVDELDEAYRAMFVWLKSGGYASHVIDFTAHYLSPYWNGHWAYSDWEWRLVRGRREFLLNRKPLSTHLACAQSAGFEVKSLRKVYDSHGLKTDSLAPHFQGLDAEDLQTSGAVVILRKP